MQEIQSAAWTRASIPGVLATRGCTISAKTKKFPDPNKDFMMSCPGVFNIDHGKHMSIKRRVEVIITLFLHQLLFASKSCVLLADVAKSSVGV